MKLNKIYVNGEATFVEAWSPKQSGICPLQEEADIPSMHFVANGRRLYRPEVVAGQLYKSGMDPVTAWTTAGALINRDDGLVDPSAYLTEPTGIMGAANFVATGIMGFADYRDYYLAETLRMAGIEGEQGVVWQKLENLNPASNNEALRDVRYALTQLEQPEEEQNIVPGVLPKPEVLVAGLAEELASYTLPAVEGLVARVTAVEAAFASLENNPQHLGAFRTLVLEIEAALGEAQNDQTLIRFPRNAESLLWMRSYIDEIVEALASTRHDYYVPEVRDKLVDLRGTVDAVKRNTSLELMRRDPKRIALNIVSKLTSLQQIQQAQQQAQTPPRYKWIAIGAAVVAAAAVGAYLYFKGED